MYIFNISQPLTLILSLTAIVLLIFLAQEQKNSTIALLPLIAFLIIIIIHGIQIFTLKEPNLDLRPILSTCLVIDFIFIGISFFGYLWVDDIEAKDKGKKSIDNSLEWFWRNV